ncbi:hypothetical protein D3C76_1797420 [compost metagenome]
MLERGLGENDFLGKAHAASSVSVAVAGVLRSWAWTRLAIACRPAACSAAWFATWDFSAFMVCSATRSVLEVSIRRA